jgi:hypothetical protein
MQPALDPVRPQITRGQQPLVAAPADAGHKASGHGFVDQLGERACRLALVPLDRLSEHDRAYAADAEARLAADRAPSSRETVGL